MRIFRFFLTSTLLLGALTLALPDSARAADRFTRMAVQAEAAGPQWVNCANEGQKCSPGTSELVTVRYGLGADFTYFITEGVSQVPCSNFWGDPSRGNTKGCAFIKKNLLGVAAGSTFQKVANEGKSFTNSGSAPNWARYGINGKWVYTVIDSGQKMACTNSYFGFDPVKGTTKVCEMGGPFELGYESLDECATENQTCDVRSGDVVGIRYGTESSYDFRFVHRGDAKIPCENNYFGVDPIHKTKRCYYQPIEPKDVETVGKWTKIISCDGKDCPITHNISVGTTKTNTWSTTSTWGITVTTSMEAGITIVPVNAKVSSSISTSYSQSFGFTSALSQSITQTYTAQCDPSGAYNSRALWQFSTQTVESCFENGQCSGSTFTAEYLCVGDAPGDYKGPACLPGYCANELCTQCTYDS